MNLKQKYLCLALIFILTKGFGQSPEIPSGKPDSVLVNNLLEQSKEKFTRNPSDAINLANQAKKVAEKINYPSGIAYSFKNIGIGYYLQGQFLQSMENYKYALAIFDSIGDKKGSCNILSNIGAIYYDKGDNALALEYHLRSLRLAEETGDKLRIATALVNIGGVYQESAPEKALQYFRKSLVLSREIQNDAMIGTASVNLGEIYLEKDIYDSALFYFDESLKAYSGTGDISYTLNDIGKVYTKNKKFDLALKMYQQAYDTAKKNSNMLDMVRTLISIAETHFHMGHKKIALDYYTQAQFYSNEIGAKNETKNIYEGLSRNYAGMGMFDSAFKYQVLLTNIRDTLYNIETNNKLSDLQFEFDLQTKENQIKSLTHEKMLGDTQLKNEKILRYALFTGLGLIIILAVTQWRHNTNRKKANKLLQWQKIETEQQREKALKALDDLKSTQTQLVQSEKMASLGELTAGIAHEIQNPLNFVINFSEVNEDLLVELNEEIEKGNYDAVKELAKDVTDNEQKINHHGKRADAIVKGMLQHSRRSSMQKEPTDINVLTDEYLRLSYHGLRAKDKSFNATIKTDFDSTLKKIDTIPQDIGRVILNLLTNAFYVVNEKKQQQPDGYEPTVSVSTKRMADKVLIRVRDNGNGIPPKVLDKIFQPFFTTKPTGQGTGLGLSLSYEIITKGHGGELEVKTKEGEGTEFVISLPA